MRDAGLRLRRKKGETLTYHLCVVADVLLNHHIKKAIFVEVTKRGFTGLKRLRLRVTLIIEMHYNHWLLLC